MHIAPEQAQKHVVAPLAKERILAAVDELFYTQGSRAVGVDAVAKKAGLNKMALYRQFDSKDGLLIEYLRKREENYWQRFEESLAKKTGQPAEQLLQIFEDFKVRASRHGYRGCPFVNVAIEYPDPSHLARQAVAKNKALLLARFKSLAQEAKVSNPDMLANSLAIIFEGACAASQTYESSLELIKHVPEIAKNVINSYLK